MIQLVHCFIKIFDNYQDKNGGAGLENARIEIDAIIMEMYAIFNAK